MYRYSPISTILIKNFRNIGDIAMDFAESPIIALCGDNEAGKTSVVKSLAVCLLHAYAREQKDYIRDSTQGFGVAVSLEDGSQVVRLKTGTINRYTVKNPDGTVWETDKIDAGLPVQVSSIMGLSEEPETREYLQIRTYENQLLFVTTAASSNYKVMYDALKVDHLTRAIKAGSLEVNALKAEMGAAEIGIQTLNENLRQMRVINLEPVVNIKNRIKEQLNKLDRIDAAVEKLHKIERARIAQGSLSLIAQHGLTELQVDRAATIINSIRLTENIARLSKLSSKYSDIATLNELNPSVLNQLNMLYERSKRQEELLQAHKANEKVEQLQALDTGLLDKFNKAASISAKIYTMSNSEAHKQVASTRLVEQRDFNAITLANSIEALISKISAAKGERDTLDANISATSDILKNCGALVSNCPKCGETIIMETPTSLGGAC